MQPNMINVNEMDYMVNEMNKIDCGLKEIIWNMNNEV